MDSCKKITLPGIPKLKHYPRVGGRCGQQYCTDLEKIIFPIQSEMYIAPVCNINEVHTPYKCEECGNSYYFQSSLDDHNSRQSWVLGYWCYHCFKDKCVHNFDSNSLCEVCMIENKHSYLETKDFKTGRRVGEIQLFHNNCKFLNHLKKHGILEVDPIDVMFMPLPPNINKNEYTQLHKVCKVLMEYMFFNEIHIIDWLQLEGIEFEWWLTNAQDNNPVAKLLKRFETDAIAPESPKQNKLNITQVPKEQKNSLVTIDQQHTKKQSNRDVKIADLDKPEFLAHWRKTRGKLSCATYNLKSPYGSKFLDICFLRDKGKEDILYLRQTVADSTISYKQQSDTEAIIKEYGKSLLIDLHKKSVQDHKIRAIIHDIKDIRDKIKSIDEKFIDMTESLNRNNKFMEIIEKFWTGIDHDSLSVEEDDDDVLNKKFNQNYQQCDLKLGNMKKKCTECRRTVKPEIYMPGVSAVALNESEFCQCSNYICHICSSKQGSARRYDAHLKFHRGEPPFQCPECFVEFKSPYLLEIHIWMKCLHINTHQLLSCRVCGIEGFFTIEDLTRHYLHVHATSAVSCPRCQRLLRSYSDYKAHYLKDHDAPNSTVPDPEPLIICDFGHCLVRPENFCTHLQTAHPEIGTTNYFSCPFCSFSIKNVEANRETIRSHVLKTHTNRLSEVIASKPLQFLAAQYQLRISTAPSYVPTPPAESMANVAAQRIVAPKRTVVKKDANGNNLSCNLKSNSNLVIRNNKSNSNCTHLSNEAANDPAHIKNSEIIRCPEMPIVERQLNDSENNMGELTKEESRVIEEKGDVTDAMISGQVLKNVMTNIQIPLKKKEMMAANKKRKPDVPTCPVKKRRRFKRVSENPDPSTLGISIQRGSLEAMEGNFKCRKCDIFFEEVHILREHMATNHRIREHYLCLECGENFVVASSLQMHLKAFHFIPDPIKYMSQNPAYAPEDLCESQESQRIESNQCHVCRRFFEDKATVDKHLRVHGMAYLNRIEARNALKSSEKMPMK